ncbi:MAG: Bug family tripartite tricarboxylate transporter substrate binding protein [Hydrogenophaga sp.]|uniref:Bug family tripartite tricarboxylate transporter substrate binding protein n=1 Tax=Hydrogenophaga sp. TaxID=1904254 RepID=UPI003D9AE31D
MSIFQPRRSLLKSALVAAAIGLSMISGVSAQDKQTVRILVGFPPGAGTDTLARIYGDALSQSLGVNIVVENKPGAGGLLANQALKQATPESNSLLFVIDHQVVMVPLINKNPGFDVKKDMVPVGRITNVYSCLVVNASSPAMNLQSFAELVRKTPTAGNYGIPAPGAKDQFMGYVVGQHFKVSMNAIPYRGSAPAVTDLVGGQVAAVIVPCDATVDQYVKTGKLRVLAMGADKRIAAMPDVPTFAEQGVKMPVDSFLGVYAAASMKPELLRQITEATRKLFDNPKMIERIQAVKMEPAYAGPDELRQIVDRNAAFWGEQVRQSNFQIQ